MPIENTVEDSHFSVVPGEPPALRLVDPLFELDAVPVESQPAGVPVDLLPSRIVVCRRIGPPPAATVTLVAKHRMGRFGSGNRLLSIPMFFDAGQFLAGLEGWICKSTCTRTGVGRAFPWASKYW